MDRVVVNAGGPLSACPGSSKRERAVSTTRGMRMTMDRRTTHPLCRFTYTTESSALVRARSCPWCAVLLFVRCSILRDRDTCNNAHARRCDIRSGRWRLESAGSEAGPRLDSHQARRRTPPASRAGVILQDAEEPNNRRRRERSAEIAGIGR